MAKLAVALMLFCTSSAMTNISGTLQVRSEVDQWPANAKEKVIHLHFYVQVVSSGTNTTEVTAAQAPKSNKSPTGFGTVNVIDDHLTEGPELTSNRVGRAEGIVSFTGQDDLVFLLIVNFVFTSGEFNGSSLTMLGRNKPVLPLREMPIVGGTGVFRLARGFATTKTYQFNATAGNGVYEYNVVVIHY